MSPETVKSHPRTDAPASAAGGPFAWLGLAAAFAVAFYCMFPPADLDLLGFVALVPLLLLIERPAGTGALFGRAFLAGWVAFALGFLWLRHVTWVGIFLLAGLCASYVALFAVLMRVVAPRPSLTGYGFCMAAWAGSEYLRGVLFGGIPWFLLGHTQYKVIPVMQITDITGVYGLSALLAGLNYLVAWLVGGPWRAAGARGSVGGADFQRACLVQALLVAGVVGYGLITLPPPAPPDGPRVAVIQGNIPQDLKTQFTAESVRQIYTKYQDLTLAIREPYDLVAWPETMYPYPIGFHRENVDELRTMAGLLGKDFLVGVLTTLPVDADGEKYRTYNSAYLFRADGSIDGRYDKMHLVPIGETVPGMHRFPLLGRLVELLSALGSAPDLIPGDRMSIFQTGPHRFGVLICFDVIFPNLYREWCRRGARFVVAVSNDGWFRDGAELEQSLIISQFNCASTKLGMARAMNTGISSFIDPYGRAQVLTGAENLTKEVEGVMVQGVHLSAGTTIYARWGDWFGQGCAGVLIAGAMLAWLNLRRKLLTVGSGTGRVPA